MASTLGQSYQDSVIPHEGHFNSTQLNSKMFICNMQEHTYNHIGSLKPMTGLFDSTYI